MATKKEKDEKFMQYWENSMELGRLLYSLINGGLIAIVLFIITLIGYFLFTQSTFLGLNMDTFLSFGVCFFIGFVFFYIPIWNINSFKYKMMKNTPKKKKKKF